MRFIVIGIVSMIGFGLSMAGTHAAVEHQENTVIVEQKEPVVKPVDELYSKQFRSYYYRLRNASDRPKRFVVENDEGERIEFTVKRAFKYYIEND